MYILKVGEEIFFKPGVENLALSNVKVELELNNSGSLYFTIAQNHEWYNKITELTTYIELYDDKDEWLWGFRILDIDEDFMKNKVVYCEGWLSFLVDTVMRPFQMKGDIIDMVKLLVNNHNKQVETYKQFTVGNVTVVDSNSYINRSSGNYENSLNTMKAKLLGTHGGYIRVRKENGKKYLDYINDYNSISNQTIRFGENLLDLTKYTKAGSVKTAIIPLGAELEDQEGINGIRPRLTISSVNGSKDYLIDETAASTWGYVWGTIDFEDVTLASNLLTKAKAQLKELIFSEMVLELNAVDLSYIKVNTERIRLGDWVMVESIPHGLQKRLLVNKVTLNLNNPANDTFVLGGTIKTFTASVNEKNRELSLFAENIANSNYNFINEMIEHQTNLLTGGHGGYIYFGTNADGYFNEMYIMDTPDKDTAKKVWRYNLSGLGFSKSGVNGPYETAWTLDGAFNANYITAGTIKGIKLEGNSITGGTIVGANIQSNTKGYKALEIINGQVYFFDWETTHHWIGKINPSVETATRIPRVSLGHAKSSALSISYYDSDDQSDSESHSYIIFDQYLNNGRSYPIEVFRDMNIRNILVFASKHQIYGNANDLIIKANRNILLSPSNSSSSMIAITLSDTVIYNNLTVSGSIGVTSSLTVGGSLKVNGAKNRIVETEHYGTVALNAVESTECLFEDNGSYELNDEGQCTIYFDEVFKECISTNYEYYVQLTKCGKGDLYVSEKHEDFFIVVGTPNLRFDWNVKAKQKGYELNRLVKEEIQEVKE